ncbi:MAG: SRPBCC family protein [Chloroflexi bacterium]|nr:SRPBCC family protein [Chloroflexota bacterium]
MARPVEKQIVIERPPEVVFAYVSDLLRHPEWAAHKLRLEQTSEGAVGVGSTFLSVGHEMGRDNEENVVVTEMVPNSKFVFEAEGNAGRFRHHFVVEGADGSTRLTKGTEGLQINPLLFKLLTPVLVAFLLPNILNGDLKRIKAKLEEGAG